MKPVLAVIVTVLLIIIPIGGWLMFSKWNEVAPGIAERCRTEQAEMASYLQSLQSPQLTTVDTFSLLINEDKWSSFDALEKNKLAMAFFCQHAADNGTGTVQVRALQGQNRVLAQVRNGHYSE